MVDHLLNSSYCSEAILRLSPMTLDLNTVYPLEVLIRHLRSDCPLFGLSESLPLSKCAEESCPLFFPLTLKQKEGQASSLKDAVL